jgi:hypothetical protein
MFKVNLNIQKVPCTFANVTKLLVISSFFNAMMWMLTCALCQTLDILFGFPSEILFVRSVGKLQDILIFQAKKNGVPHSAFPLCTFAGQITLACL